MIAIFLLSGGCHGIAKRDIQRLVRPPVCPFCKAVSIDECHCFHAIEGAGYCQTSWASLDPTLDAGPSERSGLGDKKEIPLEELPTPQALLAPQAEGMPHSVRGSRDATDDVQPVAPPVMLPAMPPAMPPVMPPVVPPVVPPF
jgi:hypothetical protein